MISPVAALQPLLTERPAAATCWVAYSGGLDSHVLLHALAACGVPGLRAVHVNHGLSPRAGEWADHCRQVCAGLRIPCTVLAVDARPTPGQSPEAAAREARYRALATLVGEGDWLLTAQHQDDQAETLLLQLLRGAGPAGLAGMPARRRFGAGWLVRPLLECTRADLRSYARAHGLAWVEDESNSDTGLDRNYLRHHILPRLAERWPAVADSFGRAAGHCAEAVELLEQLAEQDLERTVSADGSLHASLLADLTPARQRNLLRHWIAGHGVSLPSAVRLEGLRSQCLFAGSDRQPHVSWGEVEVRRYRDGLHLLMRLDQPPAPGTFVPWEPERPLELPAGAGTLRAEPVVGAGLSVARLAGRSLTVGFRAGGERVQLAGEAHHRELKTLLQAAGMPPWERERMPLVRVDGELAAAGDRWVCSPFAAGPGEPGWRLRWERSWGPAGGPGSGVGRL